LFSFLWPFSFLAFFSFSNQVRVLTFFALFIVIAQAIAAARVAAITNV
jgi:hypothetical protein